MSFYLRPIDIAILLLFNVIGWMICTCLFHDYFPLDIENTINDYKQGLYTITFNILPLYYILLVFIVIIIIPVIIIILLVGGLLVDICFIVTLSIALTITIITLSYYFIRGIIDVIYCVIIKLFAVPTPTIPANVAQPLQPYHPMTEVIAPEIEIVEQV